MGTVKDIMDNEAVLKIMEWKQQGRNRNIPKLTYVFDPASEMLLALGSKPTKDVLPIQNEEPITILDLCNQFETMEEDPNVQISQGMVPGGMSGFEIISRMVRYLGPVVLFNSPEQTPEARGVYLVHGYSKKQQVLKVSIIEIDIAGNAYTKEDTILPNGIVSPIYVYCLHRKIVSPIG